MAPRFSRGSVQSAESCGILRANGQWLEPHQCGIRIGDSAIEQSAADAAWVEIVLVTERHWPNWPRHLAIAVLVVSHSLVLFAGFFAPYNPTAQNREMVFAPPSRVHLMGSDAYGRDQFSRFLYGGRISLVA